MALVWRFMMAVSVSVCDYGRSAYEALGRTVDTIRCGDALAPVTVLVPGERVGVAARRALARGVGRSAPGVAGVGVSTLRRLAETVAVGVLAGEGRRALTKPVLVGGVHAALRAEPGLFGPVADHEGTARALAGAHRDLRALRDDTVELVGSVSPVAADTVRIHRAVRERVARTSFDERDLVEAATALTAGGAFDMTAVGVVVLFLPQDLDDYEVRFLAELGEHVDLRVVLGLTGDERADAASYRVVHRVAGAWASARTGPATADVVLHASDPDDEVRGVVRRVVDALTEHPGFRVGVFYGTANPYARLVHEHLGRAGISLFGRGVVPLAEGRFGRGLLGLLSLSDHDFRRGEVLGWVTDAPVRFRGQSAPSAAWERVSRAAGVVGGSDWERLRSYAAAQSTWAQEHPDSDEWARERARREAASAESLADFVAWVRELLARARDAVSWEELGGHLVQIWSELFLVDDVDKLDAADRRAVERIPTALRSLAVLDTVVESADLVMARELIEIELVDDLDRVGRIGEGVHVGSVADAVGEELDAVFVVGAAEGLLPPRGGEDPLLPDRVRELTDGGLPTSAQRSDRLHRQFLAALAAAPQGARTVSFPRGDLRRGGVRVPSRWLLPTLRHLAGRADLQATEWSKVPELVELGSYAGAVLREAFPATEQEWRQRALAEGQVAPPDDVVLVRALQVRAARASAEFTAVDGNLAGETLPDPTAGAAVSATALEAWTHCPYGYFVRYLLRVVPTQDPESVIRVSALDRGSIVHDILEKVVTRALHEGWEPAPGQPWPTLARQVVEQEAAERFARAEQEGVTGFPLLWQQDRQVLLADLRDWLDHDDQRRADANLTPVAAEWTFRDVEFPLGGEATLRLRGKIDRIDRDPHGRLTIIDYKTGKAEPYRRLRDDDPLDSGQRLQLPIYALAARAGFDTGADAVQATYWFTSRKGRFEQVGFPVDDQVLDRTRAVLTTVVAGLRAGVFPARPKQNGNPLYHCDACDADGLGEFGVAETWQRKAPAAELAALRSMLGHTPPTGARGASS